MHEVEKNASGEYFNLYLAAHLFCAWLSRVFHHKTRVLSARCNGKVRVTARKQIIHKLGCEQKSVNYCMSYLPLLAPLLLGCLQIKILTKQPR